LDLIRGEVGSGVSGGASPSRNRVGFTSMSVIVDAIPGASLVTG
jgi:hypothetical protein